MKNSILLFVSIISFVFGINAQCDGNIQTVINIAESPGIDGNLHFMWGKATKLLADHYDCKDAMEEYSGGGNMIATIYNTSWGGGFNLPSSVNLQGIVHNSYYGSYNSGYQMYSQWLSVDIVSEYIKANFPSIIDSQGKFICDVQVPIRKSGINNQWTYYHHVLVIWTDYRVVRQGVEYTCENDIIDFNQGYSSPFTLNNVYVNASAPYQATVTPGQYTAGNIGTELDSVATYTVNGQYVIPTENMTPAAFPHAGFLVGCFYNYNGGNWAVASLAQLKTLIINKTFNCPVYNLPSGNVTSAYPSPIYDNDPDVLLNSYWNMSGFSTYQFTGGGTSLNVLNNQYYFDPSVGNGIHLITLNLNNQDKCFSTVSNNITITQYPGTPNKPSLDWPASFDYTTDSAYISGGCLVPSFVEFPSGNSIIDANYYERHKFLCPNASEDSIQLYIQSPSASLIYYWKRSVNGLEEDLGIGTSKKIPRQHNPAPNVSNVYKEYVYFRSKNVVNNYSPWEYVELEYPINPYLVNSPNDSNSYVLLDSMCHDGVVNYSVTNNLLTTEAFYGMNNVSSSPIEYKRSYVYQDYNGVQNLNNSGTFNYTWNGQKLDTFEIKENAYLRKVYGSCWAYADWCDCEIRTLKGVPIKNPEITNVTAFDDTTSIGELNFLTATTTFGGNSIWYIDSVYPGFTGNSITTYSLGDEGYRSAYLIATDQYGCNVDTMVNNLYYVKNVPYVVPPTDSIMYGSSPTSPIICLDITAGGNLIVTPNSDGVNDNIEICSTNRSFVFQLMDRWGNQVMEKSNVNSIPVENLESATYYYILSDDSGSIKTGFVEIKK